MILPLPRTGPSSRCRLQLMTKIRLSSRSRTGIVIAPIDSGSSVSPSPRKHQTLRSCAGMIPRALEVAHEARLVDRHHRAQAHRHGRELPELRHQPRMRIRRQPDALARDFLTEVVQVVLAETAFEKRARVDARRRMALEVHEIAAVLRCRRAPKMIEADLVERGRRSVARDVAAVLGAHAVRVDHHRHRVPADVGLDAPLDRAIAGIFGLLADGNRVEVGGVRAIRQIRARAARMIDHALEQEVGTLCAVHSQHRVDRLEPLLRLLRVEIVAAQGDQGQRSCSRHENRTPVTRATNQGSLIDYREADPPRRILLGCEPVRRLTPAPAAL